MGLWNVIKGTLYKADLLYCGSLLRIKGQPEHKTLLGGILSLTIMTFLVAVFYNKIIGTLDKLLIISTYSTSNADDPSSYNISTYHGSNFMFGVEVWHHDLNHGNRYFDIVFTNTIYEYGEPLDSSISYEMQPCTKQHWSGFPQVQAKFQSLSMSYWKCPPKNMQFQIQGKYSSKISKTLNIDIKPCTNDSSDSSDFRPCAPQQQINEYFTNNTYSFFTIYFINPLLNPDDHNYLTYYLEDTNYIIFSPEGGAEGQIHIQDFTITTDQSIFPISNIQVATGGIVTGFALKNQYPKIGEIYATFQFFKSPSSISINRSFQKLDVTFSYIGGLFGTVLMFFFFVSIYNSYLFEVNLAGILYRSQQNSSRIEKDYNFIYFVGQGIYTILKLLKLKPNWEKLGQFYKIREEMVKQLDILYLIKRINFLERSLAFLFTDQQLKALHLSSQITMEEAAKIRHSYRLKNKLKHELNKKKSDKSDQSQKHLNKNAANNADKLMDFKPDEYHFCQSNRKSKKQEQQLDCDNYSSQKYSSQEQQPSLVSDLNTLRKYNQNQINKKIWKNIDVQLRAMLEKQRPDSSFEHLIVEEYGQNELFKQRRSPPVIQMSKLNFEENPVLSSQQRQQKLSYDQQSHQQITKKIFYNLQTIRIQSHPTKQGDNLHDYP